MFDFISSKNGVLKCAASEPIIVIWEFLPENLVPPELKDVKGLPGTRAVSAMFFGTMENTVYFRNYLMDYMEFADVVNKLRSDYNFRIKVIGMSETS